jgi:hypothetical protein
MSSISIVHQIINTSPKIVIEKGLRKLTSLIKTPLERNKILTKATYHLSYSNETGGLRSYFTSPDYHTLRPFRSTIESLANQYLNNQIDILGSTWISTTDTNSPIGVEGISYKKSNKEISDYKSGEWLRYNITDANLEESKRIWQILQSFNSSQDYQPIDWHSDLKSGFSWNPTLWHKDIKVIQGNGVDPKVPWEFGRMHHLLISSFATIINDEYKKSVQEFYTCTILDFIAQNPPSFGIQWTTSMDVAIRVINLLVSRDILNSNGITLAEEVEYILERSVREHAEHILSNLEWSDGQRGNHYLANICGLIFCGMYLPESEFQRHLLNFAIPQLQSEIVYQWNNDGGNFEASVPYHFFATEMIVWTIGLLYQIPGFELPPDVKDRLQAIAIFSQTVAYDNHTIPVIGDEDSGMFLPCSVLSTSSDIHHSKKHILELLDVILTQTPHNNPTTLEAILLGSIFQTAHQSGHSNQEIESDSTISVIPSHFADFGITAWDIPLNDELIELRIRAGSIGQNGKGGHAHNDQCSFTLSYTGNEFFVDNGTYLYTPIPEKRNEFRSTRMHNTLSIRSDEGKYLEQNDWLSDNPKDLFWFKSNRANGLQVGVFTNQHDIKSLAFEHSGYEKPHHREFTWQEDTLTIVDKCQAKGTKSVHFHLNPNCTVVQKDDCTISISLSLATIQVHCITHKLQIRDSMYSPMYGIKVKSQQIVIEGNSDEFISQLTFSKKE